MNIRIKSVDNGYILSTLDREEVYEEGNIISLLYTLLYELDGNGSKYSDKRIYIIEHPGECHQDFLEPVCPFCDRKYEEDE